MDIQVYFIKGFFSEAKDAYIYFLDPDQNEMQIEY